MRGEKRRERERLSKKKRRTIVDVPLPSRPSFAIEISLLTETATCRPSLRAPGISRGRTGPRGPRPAFRARCGGAWGLRRRLSPTSLPKWSLLLPWPSKSRSPCFLVWFERRGCGADRERATFCRRRRGKERARGRGSGRRSLLALRSDAVLSKESKLRFCSVRSFRPRPCPPSFSLSSASLPHNTSLSMDCGTTRWSLSMSF